ncbi:molecular chaperone [Pseudomonas aeruginosa]|uniref:fimbrial biogenesis chaperone n=1 Tax=Pseudomonas aeruginosa TaxID=287 RepID=UPI0015F06FE1|nr:fimbria/pilus periplasmic chaperone [Pseudomonas aeruginosa]MBA4995485.1 fimbria/pilus periplasmic chaperone [Pseudomonas aeruginosa]MBG7460358.1 fimbria/pilus periplasmic chaperone [Pseudomonas aeruginosa]HBP0513073.1 fimbria/pilus periplasmic chaperone [Pseudomonas aeruginosa]HBP0514283.1 fimbria/pilus periplasmic chaperone [Pseudomonas aeruginosa]HCL3642253.1 fimbria/pilus periplasmic chaperone [Pseudomonas aeruginosa]
MASLIHKGFFSWVAASAMVSALGVSPAEAGLVAQGTRLVFPGDEREVTLRINNTSSVPVLAQTWVDDGREDVPPEQLNMPFSVSPAVARVEPKGGLVLRVGYLGTALPKDRESVFWLNILDVPPRGEGDENALQFSFRSRLKLFFRPSQLRSVESAPAKLRWKLLGSAGGKPVVRVDNPTPYFVSFASVELLVEGHAASIGNGMVSPFSQKDFGGKKNIPLNGRKVSVRYEVINDYGGRSTLERALGE